MSALTPLVYQFGVGGIGGFIAGYALKKFMKIVAVIIGLIILLLVYLGYRGIITINYSALVDWANGVIGQVGVLEGIFSTIIGNLPFAGGFLAGFVIGVKVG